MENRDSGGLGGARVRRLDAGAVAEGLLVPGLVVVDDDAGEVGVALAAATALALHAGEQVQIAELLGGRSRCRSRRGLLVLVRLAMPGLVWLVVREHVGATVAPGLGDEVGASISVVLRSDLRQLSWEPRLLLPLFADGERRRQEDKNNEESRKEGKKRT